MLANILTTIMHTTNSEASMNNYKGYTRQACYIDSGKRFTETWYIGYIFLKRSYVEINKRGEVTDFYSIFCIMLPAFLLYTF
jgi:hypothetical protein